MLPTINFDRFPDVITRRILRGHHSHDNIIDFLQGQSMVIPRNTLKARLKQ